MDAHHLSGSEVGLSRRRLFQGAMAAGALMFATSCGARYSLGPVASAAAGAPTQTPVSVPTLMTVPPPFVAAASSVLQLPVDVSTQLDHIFQRLVQMRAFTGAVLVARDDQVLLAKGYGLADVDHQVPNQGSTRFPIASLTKQFTAMGILQLQDQGLLHVQDRIADFLDVVPPAWRDITLHELLVHTSGIPDYFSLPGFAALSTAHPTPEQLIDLFRNERLEFAPGTLWEYCDSDYVLLGHVIERVSGLMYADYLQRNICAPLALAQTGYDPSGATPHATGYADWGQADTVDDPATLYSCGGIVSTVTDMFHWLRALMTGAPRVASPLAISAMFTPYAAADAPGGPHTGQGYGYGWMIDTAVRHRRYWHPGAIDGFVSYEAIYPDDGISVIVLSNLVTSDARSAGEAAAGVLLH